MPAASQKTWCCRPFWKSIDHDLVARRSQLPPWVGKGEALLTCVRRYCEKKRWRSCSKLVEFRWPLMWICEEPYDGKLSRTVLNWRPSGRPLADHNFTVGLDVDSLESWGAARHLLITELYAENLITAAKLPCVQAPKFGIEWCQVQFWAISRKQKYFYVIYEGSNS